MTPENPPETISMEMVYAMRKYVMFTVGVRVASALMGMVILAVSVNFTLDALNRPPISNAVYAGIYGALLGVLLIQKGV